MRVISGKYQRKKLNTIDSMDTRPTTDRVKENIFNLTQKYIYGTIVIDLFAGSGGLGIEAISRGAKKVYFVENNHKMCQVLKNNLDGISEEYEVICAQALTSLEMICQKTPHIDILFLDPPYDSEYVMQCLQIVLNTSAFDQDSLIVIETHRNYQNPFLGFEVIKEKQYGQVKVILLRKGI